MGFLRRNRAEVVRKGVGDQAVEEKTVRRVGRRTVEIRRVREVAPPPEARPKASPAERPRPPRRERPRRGAVRHLEPVIPVPETERKQMLIRRTPHQTQIVVLEGALLVEHYVARSDRKSLAGNIYLGKVRNVLPGMEAAFVDFGEAKNGVLYAGDVQADPGQRRPAPRIEKALKVGDEVLVQVTKDAMGTKGARLTNQVSLPGRYLVLAPDSEVRGISRRLPDPERERLRRLVADLSPEGFGVIVRTAAEEASEDELRADVERLRLVWQDLSAKIPQGGAPRLLYEEPDLVIRVVREHFTGEFRRLLVDDTDIHK